MENLAVKTLELNNKKMQVESVSLSFENVVEEMQTLAGNYENDEEITKALKLMEQAQMMLEMLQYKLEKSVENMAKIHELSTY